MTNLVNSKDLEILLNKVAFDWFGNKRILVTGASGMLGSYLTESIVRGCEASGVDYKQIVGTSKSGNFSSISHLATNDKLKLIKHDNCFENLDDYEVIIHAASPSNPTKFRTMKELLESNLAFIKGSNFNSLENLCFFSSGEVYGVDQKSNNALTEQGESDIRSLYPRSKLLTESEIISKFSERDIKVSLPRVFHTFGPGLREHDGRSFGDFIYSVSKQKLPKLYSSGNQIRTFLYSLDFAIAILNSMNVRHVHPFDLGSAIPVSIREFAIRVSKAGGLNGAISEVASEPPGFVHSSNFRLVPDINYLAGQGWEETISLDVAISQTLEWIFKRG